ncbi:DUF2785 domain-containing protein [Pseudomarimonas arenosa]|uniref:DUF2785 domain-containing protein n=1 Tax=Pseudomarimonas arenosa TaxID=2774145 RepID=A0AAW3ZMS3_9GAMM|nr:DUF2785 domain-containing protein [Pseudomarimonas arenosa]MBD8526790.1 DUF2785 domain-containing protein [Pseudomarimonas arenosa]
MSIGCSGRLALLLGLVFALHGVQASDCRYPADWPTSLSTELARKEGAVESIIVDQMLACFDHPDPSIRDQWVYESLSQLLRARRIASVDIERAIAHLQPVLTRATDEAGYAQPFAALLLSELVRADRLDPDLDPRRLAGLAQDASRYLQGVRDYRAFDQQQGWRHGIAHGADLLLQLGVHPAVDADLQHALLQALGSQVRNREIAYAYGEPERLARVAFFLHQRNEIDDTQWRLWLQTIGEPAPMKRWSDAFQQESTLRLRHNVMGFFHALGFAARQAEGDRAAGLHALCDAQLARIMSGAE